VCDVVKIIFLDWVCFVCWRQFSANNGC